MSPDDDRALWHEWLIERLAGELDSEREILLEQHLAECEDCRALAARDQAFAAAAAPRTEWHPDPEIEARILERWRRMPTELAPTTTAGAQPCADPAEAPSPRASESRQPPRPGGWRQRLGRIFAHPLPGYAAAALLALWLIVGSPAERGRDVASGTGPAAATTPIDSSFADVAVALPTTSSMKATPRNSTRPAGRATFAHFQPALSDAMRLRRGSSIDSL